MGSELIRSWQNLSSSLRECVGMRADADNTEAEQKMQGLGSPELRKPL